MNLLIKNTSLLSFADNCSVINNIDIAIEDNLIKQIGNVSEAFTADEIIDGTNKLAMPGLINCHTHVSMSILRNYSDDLSFWPWLTEKIWPIEDKIVPEDAYWASMLSIAEMLKSGVTCFSDMYFHMEETAKAACETGIKAFLSRGLQGPDANDELRMRETRDLYRNWNNNANGRIKVWLGPHAPYTCSPEYFQKVIELAQELNTGIHIHLSESKKEVADNFEKYGKSPIKHVSDLGLFKLPTIAAHCVHVSEEDIDILSKNNVSVINNPGSNLKLGNGFAPIEAMIKSGVNVALGTDGASSNNNLNMFEEINLAALINKSVNEDPTSIPALTAVKMATINGAKALRMENETGSLEVGKKADITLLDLNKPHFYPKHNYISSLAYSAQASDVDTVIVDGKVLLQNGEYKTIDIEKVYYNIDKCTKRLFSKA